MIPEKMKALIVPGDGTWKVEEISVPECDDYEMLLKVKACAICGTDIKFINGTMKGCSDYPAVLGHEAVGEVVALGNKVRNFKLGDLVVGPFMWKDNDGYTPYWGTMAEYTTVGDYDALVSDGLGDAIAAESAFQANRIPDDMDPVAATMIVTLRETCSAIENFGFKANESIVVYGAGPVGAAFVRFCKLHGMAPVICVEVQESRRAAAQETGADYVLIGSGDEIRKQIREICPEGVNNTLDAAGVPQLINEGLRMITPYGKVCLYGETSKNQLQLDWENAPYGFSIMVDQLVEGTREVHNTVMKYIESGQVNCMDYISDVFHFSEIEEAFEKYCSKKNEKKIVIKF